MTELIYLTDSYKKELEATVVSVRKKGSIWEIVLNQTIFYPQGGGQPSDKGEIVSKHGKAHVKHVRMQEGTVIHECSIEGTIKEEETVECTIDWSLRFFHMRLHTAGHILHEAIMVNSTGLTPIKAEHGKEAFIEYRGSLPIGSGPTVERKANEIVASNAAITAEFVTREQLEKRAAVIPAHLPKHKPLRILTIEGFEPIPDGGTHVANTGEVGEITLGNIENTQDAVRVYYSVENKEEYAETETRVSAANLIGLLLEIQETTLADIAQTDKAIDELRIEYLGAKSDLAGVTKQLGLVAPEDRQQVGTVVNEVKHSLEQALAKKSTEAMSKEQEGWFDVTLPGIPPPTGHLHIVTQAIMEITRIFERIGFTRVRHPEVDWDWYPFESLNMPPNHPARDEWETFFITYPGDKKPKNPKRQQIVLTPHTSNGQVREMEKEHVPIRMINIAKCYRRQSDVSHVPMFHQFEGLYVDKNVSIAHLKGVLDYFVKQFFGPERKARIRPFHFQFTEPSFEIDISCGVCLGKGCKLCKEGWLELGGAGMTHPVVLANGGVDTNIYNGFAFGWGVERTYMMKSGTKLDDIRLLYTNDSRFLEQF